MSEYESVYSFSAERTTTHPGNGWPEAARHPEDPCSLQLLSVRGGQQNSLQPKHCDRRSPIQTLSEQKNVLAQSVGVCDTIHQKKGITHGSI